MEYIYVDEQGNRIDPKSLNLGAGLASPSYPPISMPRNEKADLLDKIKPDIIVETIRNKLMGKEYINGEWRTNDKLKHRALTDVGAWDIANLMLGVSSQNVALSKLNDREIRSRTLEIVKTAQLMMLKNWKEYGIKGIDQLAFVHQIIISNTFITLKQPEGEGIRKLLKGTTSENRIINEQESRRSRIKDLIFRSR